MSSSSPISIIKILKNLSNTPSNQVKYLENLFHSELNDKSNIDELALEFHDDFLLAPIWLDNRKISPTIMESLRRIDSKLDQMSGQENMHLWTINALYTSREWEEVRMLSKSCLELFDES